MSAPTEAAVSAKVRRIALIGNPNTGKTTLFNALTGLRQRVGNYPGVTVEKKVGAYSTSIELIDLPGTYSLAARSPDERVAVSVLLGAQEGEARPDAVVVIIDASNLQRNLYLLTQVIEIGLPVIVALNMIDLAEKAGVTIDVPALAKSIGVPVIPCVATRADGLNDLRKAIEAPPGQAIQPGWAWPEGLAGEIKTLSDKFGDGFLSARGLIDEGGAAEEMLAAKSKDALQMLSAARERLKSSQVKPAALEAQMRYGWIARQVGACTTRRPMGTPFTAKLDGILTHRFFGTLVFIVVMGLLFSSIFVLAKPIMDGIKACFDGLSAYVAGRFAGTASEGGALQSLLTKGIVDGIGSVMVFLPQIAFLFLFIAVLEDCGYMARAAFLMDRLLRFCGLSGHSFIPLMSSFACAVPGIMATRTIADRKDRLATILVAPLMSCSARIPVYALMIGAFIPAVKVGFLPLQGLVFAAMYFVGILAAIPVAFLLKRTLLKGPAPIFLMELPTYKWPSPRTVLLRVWEASKAFTLRAGTIIFAFSVLIWALCYFPRSEETKKRYEEQREEAKATLSDEAPEADAEAPAGEATGAEDEKKETPKSPLAERLDELDRLEQGELLRNSAMGRAGQALEPFFKPLGWDWRIGMAALASFPAREVVVVTMGIIYDLGEIEPDEEGAQKQLSDKFRAATWPDGRPVYTIPVALSIMVFFALCCQCMATVVTIKRESTWGWAIFAFTYMTALAYVGAFATFQIGTALLR